MGKNPGRAAPSGLFETFSDRRASSLSDLDSFTDIGICFEDAIIGLAKDALLGEDVWFAPSYCPSAFSGASSANSLGDSDAIEQRNLNWRGYEAFYAATEQVESGDECSKSHREKLASSNLEEFRSFILDSHGLINTLPERLVDEHSVLHITLLSRARRRLVLNEMDLVATIESEISNSKVSLVQFETLSFHEQVEVARRSHVMIGMHGAGLTNAIWMPEHSVVLELFPYRYYKPTYAENRFVVRPVSCAEQVRTVGVAFESELSAVAQ